jgi:hypothetical protein
MIYGTAECACRRLDACAEKGWLLADWKIPSFMCRSKAQFHTRPIELKGVWFFVFRRFPCPVQVFAEAIPRGIRGLLSRPQV